MENALNSEQLSSVGLLVSSSIYGAMLASKQNVVGPQVRRLRMAAALSQEALAAKLQLAGWDLSRAGVSKIEAGLRRVNDAEVWMLAKVLCCQLNDLFPTGVKVMLQVLRQGSSARNS